jgi:hypothetical protein
MRRPYADVLEMWTERAAIREYEGGATRADAERLAYDDFVDVYVRQLNQGT